MGRGYRHQASLEKRMGDSTMAAGSICFVHCEADESKIRELELPESMKSISIRYVNIELGSASSDYYDIAASTIESSDHIIISLSIDFVRVVSAFTTLIFITRSLRKETSYILPSSSYIDLVNDPTYIKSTVSLLVANSFVFVSWTGLCRKLRNHFQRISTATIASMDKSSEREDCDLVDGNEEQQSQCCYCCSSEDERYTKDIILGLKRQYSLSIVDIESFLPSSNKVSCVLLFVSTNLAAERSKQELLDKLIKSDTPKLVLVINDDESWLRTGLGLRLADELWVDCRHKKFHLPGEVIPTIQDKLKEVYVRINNIKLHT